MNNTRKIVCPKCGKANFAKIGVTPIYEKPVLRDSVYLNNAADGAVYMVRCLSCGHSFAYSELKEKPKSPTILTETPTSTMPITTVPQEAKVATTTTKKQTTARKASVKKTTKTAK